MAAAEQRAHVGPYGRALLTGLPAEEIRAALEHGLAGFAAATEEYYLNTAVEADRKHQLAIDKLTADAKEVQATIRILVSVLKEKKPPRVDTHQG